MIYGFDQRAYFKNNVHGLSLLFPYLLFYTLRFVVNYWENIKLLNLLTEPELELCQSSLHWYSPS